MTYECTAIHVYSHGYVRLLEVRRYAPYRDRQPYPWRRAARALAHGR